MTVPTNARKTILDGDGSVESFPFLFFVFSTSDLRVVKTDADGIETDLVLDAAGGYSVTLDGTAPCAGSVTYPVDSTGTTLATGETITILRDIDYTQETDITNAGSFRAQVIENALDKMTMLVLQLKELADRSLTIPISVSSDVSAVLPFPVAGNAIAWNSDATGLENVDPLDGASMFSALDSQNAICDRFTATAAQTAFTLTETPGSENAIDVYIDGVHQNANSYLLSGTPERTLTLDTARSVGEVVEVRYRLLGAVSSTFTPAALSVTTSKLAADAVTYSKLDSSVRTRIDFAITKTDATSHLNQTWAFTHALAGAPTARIFSMMLTCKTSTDAGYLVGDTVMLAPGCDTDGSNYYGYTIKNASTTGFSVKTASHGLRLPHSVTGDLTTIDPLKWNITMTVMG